MSRFAGSFAKLVVLDDATGAVQGLLATLKMLNLIYNARCWVILLLVALGSSTAPCGAIERPGEVLDKEVGVFTELGKKVDLSQRFTNVAGETRALRDFAVAGKPIVIAPVYYKCPRLCGLLLDGVYNLLNEIPLKLSADFSVLVVGFDPNETSEDAAKVMNKFNAKLIGDPATRTAAIQYVVGGQEQVRALMGDLGFKYMRDGEDFAHSAALMILTPTGEISQYFTGIMFSPWDAKLALVEASKGEIGTAIDHLLLYCFRFDPLQGRYTWAVIGLLRVGGALTLIGLAMVYFFFARKRRRGARAAL
jgi:protein SCO1/2